MADCCGCTPIRWEIAGRPVLTHGNRACEHRLYGSDQVACLDAVRCLACRQTDGREAYAKQLRSRQQGRRGKARK